MQAELRQSLVCYLHQKLVDEKSLLMQQEHLEIRAPLRGRLLEVQIFPSYGCPEAPMIDTSFDWHSIPVLWQLTRFVGNSIEISHLRGGLEHKQHHTFHQEVSQFAILALTQWQHYGSGMLFAYAKRLQLQTPVSTGCVLDQPDASENVLQC